MLNIIIGKLNTLPFWWNIFYSGKVKFFIKFSPDWFFKALCRDKTHWRRGLINITGKLYTSFSSSFNYHSLSDISSIKFDKIYPLKYLLRKNLLSHLPQFIDILQNVEHYNRKAKYIALLVIVFFSGKVKFFIKFSPDWFVKALCRD